MIHSVDQGTVKSGSLLSAAVLIASASPAYGQIQAFENDGSFDWDLFVSLDITKSAADQTGADGTLAQGGYAGASYAYTYVVAGGSNGAGVVAFTPPTGGLNRTRVVGLDPGFEIGGGNNFSNFGYVIPRSYLQLQSLIPEGTASYLGVALQLAGSPGLFNYGWVKVERNGADLDALAWGYNTVAGESIQAGQIPTPGTLAALAFGALAAGSRPRRAS